MSEKTDYFFRILDNVKIDHEMVFGFHPEIICPLIFLLDRKVIHEVDVRIGSNPHFDIFNGVGSVIDPEIAGKGKLLFVAWLEHDVITPFVPKECAVDQIIMVIFNSKGRDRAYKILLEERNVVFIYINFL